MDYNDQKFENTRVVLDGNGFSGCTFTKCNLVIKGMADFRLVSSSISHCTYLFEGPAARTLGILKALYQMGETTVVEKILQEIKGNAESQSSN